MSDSKLHLTIKTEIDFVDPPKDAAEERYRLIANQNMQAAANKLHPVVTQMLITFVNELMHERAAVRDSAGTPKPDPSPKQESSTRNPHYVSPYADVNNEEYC